MAQALQRRLTSIDVSDPHLYQDDTWRPLFEQLRRDDPVHYCEASPFGPYWSVTRYDDIFAVELDHENYSSSSELGGIQVADQPKGQERTSFIRMDPPEHDRQRRMLTQEFMIKRMAAMRPDVDRVVDALLDDMVAVGPPADLVESFALPLPSLVICQLLGVPYEDHAFFQECSRVMIDQTSEPAAVQAARERLQAYLDRLVSDKAVRPAEIGRAHV